MKNHPLILCTLVQMFLGLTLAAADDTANTPVYDVEIIIFKNNAGPKGREQILPVSAAQIPEKIIDLASAKPAEIDGKLAYQALPAEQLRLLDKAQRLINSPYYDLLLHLGWRQPGQEKSQSLPVWIRGGNIFSHQFSSIDSRLAGIVSDTAPQTTTNESEQKPLAVDPPATQNPEPIYELEGTITVTLSRYLHAYVDLVLRRPAVPSSQKGFDRPQILHNHRLQEHRRLRSKRLHYLDSPEFALLILITPYEAPVPTHSDMPIMDDNPAPVSTE